MLDKILADPNIKNIINSINDVIIIDNYGCHGMNHALRVMKYVEIILKGINATEHEVELGKIAAYLHDVGAVEGKKGHATRSAKMAKEYLSKIKMSQQDIDIIVHAIKHHSNGDELNTSIDASLTFADKIDMFKDRMLRFKEDNYFHDNIKHMLNIDLSINNEFICINIITDGKFEYNSLKEYSKMITKPYEMASYLKRKCIFLIDGKIIDLLSIVKN